MLVREIGDEAEPSFARGTGGGEDIAVSAQLLEGACRTRRGGAEAVGIGLSIAGGPVDRRRPSHIDHIRECRLGVEAAAAGLVKGRDRSGELGGGESPDRATRIEHEAIVSVQVRETGQNARDCLSHDPLARYRLDEGDGICDGERTGYRHTALIRIHRHHDGRDQIATIAEARLA